MLEPVGVTGTAARVYVELVETDQLSVAEAAERCGISVRRATTELRHIAALGLAFQVTGRPVRYRAVAPDLAISGLVAQREKELQDVRATMHRLTEVFQETSRGRHPDAQVEVVHGTPNIARLADRVHEQTQHQVRGFDRPPYSREPGTGYRMERSRLAAGVAYRVIYDGDALAIPGRMYDDILPSSAAGEQARTRPQLPIKLIISDDQLALIPAAVSSRSIDTTFVIHRSPDPGRADGAVRGRVGQGDCDPRDACGAAGSRFNRRAPASRVRLAERLTRRQPPCWRCSPPE